MLIGEGSVMFVLKKLEDDPEHENMVQLSGTIIQRTLFFDARRFGDLEGDGFEARSRPLPPCRQGMPHTLNPCSVRAAGGSLS